MTHLAPASSPTRGPARLTFHSHSVSFSGALLGLLSGTHQNLTRASLRLSLCLCRVLFSPLHSPRKGPFHYYVLYSAPQSSCHTVGQYLRNKRMGGWKVLSTPSMELCPFPYHLTKSLKIMRTQQYALIKKHFFNPGRCSFANIFLRKLFIDYLISRVLLGKIV